MFGIGLFLIFCASIPVSALSDTMVYTSIPVHSGTPEDAGCGIFLRAGDQAPRLLTAGFFEARDACVSFDGERMVFSGRKSPDDSFSIWEMPLSGGSAQPLLAMDGGDCLEPIYLPEAGVNPPMFDMKSPWVAFVFRETHGRSASIYVYSLNEIPGHGHVLWRVTYSPEPEFGPVILDDGRVVFSSVQEADTALLFVTWAGDNLNLMFRNESRPSLKADAAALAGRQLAFVECGLDGSRETGGRLAWIRLQRPLNSYRSSDAELPGRFRTPAGFPDGRMMVAYRPPEADYGLYWFDPETGRLGKVFQDEKGRDEIDPQPVIRREPPISRIPMVEFASVLDISGFSDAGQLHCMNVYDSTLPEVRNLEPGTVRRARFITPLENGPERPDAVPAEVAAVAPAAWPSARIGYRIMGEVPVERDGSFFVNLMGNRPYSIQLLDADGLAIATMRAWSWIRSGGQRGCIGCHENKELSPDNRATEALIKKDAAFLTCPEEEWGTIGFREDVAPILEARCSRCHRGPRPRAGMDFSDPVRAYVGLVAGTEGKMAKVLPNDARNSRLIKMVRWWKLQSGPGMDVPPNMPPDRQLSEEEQRLISDWVDLGCRWTSAASEDAGK
jgi:hypothetical protein